MLLLKIRRLLWIAVLVLKKIVESVVIVTILIYLVMVFDIYINTEKLSKVSPVDYLKSEKIANNPKFTKGPVTIRVDRGTLGHRLGPYIIWGGMNAYAPVALFPHNRTIVIGERMLDSEYLDVFVAHELGHIQGGWTSFGKVVDSEKYADSFATEVVGNDRFNLFRKHLQELSKQLK